MNKNLPKLKNPPKPPPKSQTPPPLREPSGHVRNGDAGNNAFEFVMIICSAICLAYVISELIK